MRSIEEIARYSREIRLRNYPRDQRMGNVRAARSGDVTHIIPGLMPDTWPRPIVANTIDIAARFTAEQVGILPTISCTSGVMVSDRQKKYAAKRTLITHHYVGESRLRQTLVQAADWFDMYGFLPLVIEPHFGDAYCPPGPRLRFENPMGVYYDLTAYGRTKCYFKVYEEEAAVLAARFPHLARSLVDDPSQLTRSNKLEMIQYVDDDQIVVFLPQRSNLVIHQMPNAFGRCPVRIAERPKYDSEIRGSFDDVIWVHLARARFAMLGLNAAEKAVNAPLILPNNSQKIAFGPEAVLRTDTPQGVGRLKMELPPATFQVGEMLNQEVMTGSRFPENATGKSPGSIVTGAAIDALNGTIDTKVRTSQQLIGEMLMLGLSDALEMDQKFWPRLTRHIRVNVNGNSYEESYTPLKDINGVYQVDVTYGMAAGMDVNRGLVFLLQARGDKLISRDFALRQLPFDINVDQVMEQIDTEEMVDALKQGIFSMLGAVGVLAQQGQDPVELLSKAAAVIKERERGTPFQDAVLKAFQPKTPPGGSAPPGAGLAPGAGPPGAGGPPGMPPGGPQSAVGALSPSTGMPPGVAPGQAGQGPGGTPDIMKMLAGLSGGGGPNLQANVQRKAPIGG